MKIIPQEDGTRKQQAVITAKLGFLKTKFFITEKGTYIHFPLLGIKANLDKVAGESFFDFPDISEFSDGGLVIFLLSENFSNYVFKLDESKTVVDTFCGEVTQETNVSDEVFREPIFAFDLTFIVNLIGKIIAS